MGNGSKPVWSVVKNYGACLTSTDLFEWEGVCFTTEATAQAEHQNCVPEMNFKVSGCCVICGELS